MFYIEKTFEISAAHQLHLTYESKCSVLHGHNWVITVWCKSEKLDENGMVIDFNFIKHNVKERLDHQNLNEVLPFNPTAENIAKWVADQVPQSYKVRVQETMNNVAIYEK